MNIKYVNIQNIYIGVCQYLRALVGWLVVFGLNDPLRQYFSLYRVVSQREGEKAEKG